MSSRTEVVKLEKLFSAVPEYSPADYSSDVNIVRALVAYFRFIEDTSWLKIIAQKILTDRPLMVIRPLGKFYATLQEAWKLEYNPTNTALLQRDISLVRKATASFHGYLLAAAKRNVQLGDQRLLEKDTTGDFFYNRKRVELSREAIYYQVLDAVYSRADQNGFASYKVIERHFLECGRPAKSNDAKRNKRINNAISKGQGLFAHGLKNKTLDGKKLIEIIRSKGLKLTNPTIPTS
jgi:hypothetical protein